MEVLEAALIVGACWTALAVMAIAFAAAAGRADERREEALARHLTRGARDAPRKRHLLRRRRGDGRRAPLRTAR